MSDVIDTLAGIAPGSPLDAIRNQRLQARTHAQASYDSLFKPISEADASKPERIAIACFVAGLHGRPEMAAAELATPDTRVLVEERRGGAIGGTPPAGIHPHVATHFDHARALVNSRLALLGRPRGEHRGDQSERDEDGDPRHFPPPWSAAALTNASTNCPMSTEPQPLARSYPGPALRLSSPAM